LGNQFARILEPDHGPRPLDFERVAHRVVERKSQRPSAREVRCTDLLAGFRFRISRLVLDLASAKHTCLS
jgi:hypothetical protein